jgi:hypothetical protein
VTLVVAGLDPGVRYVGLGVVVDGLLVRSECWTMPGDLTAACVALRRELERLVVLEHVQVLAFEGFTFHREKGWVNTAKAMYALLGVVRSLQGWECVTVREVPAGVWGQRFTGQRVPAQGPGRQADEWKRQVAWYVHRQAGRGWSWGDDVGYHRSDAAGIAFQVTAELRQEALTLRRGRDGQAAED